MASGKGRTLGTVEGSAVGRFGDGVTRQSTEDLQGSDTALPDAMRGWGWGGTIIILLSKPMEHTAPRAGPHVNGGLQLHDVSVLVREFRHMCHTSACY